MPRPGVLRSVCHKAPAECQQTGLRFRSVPLLAACNSTPAVNAVPAKLICHHLMSASGSALQRYSLQAACTCIIIAGFGNLSEARDAPCIPRSVVAAFETHTSHLRPHPYGACMAEEDPGCPNTSNITRGASVDSLISTHHGGTHKMTTAHRCIASFILGTRPFMK